MKRQNVDGGGWLDLSEAQSWKEDTWWNGHNHVGVSSGDQFAHQTLYHTAKGAWVIHHTSQWEGTRDRWERIGEEEAAQWLILNKHADDLPENLQHYIEESEV